MDTTMDTDHCACGCGKELPAPDYMYTKRPVPRFLNGHNQKGHNSALRKDPERPLCLCGCGQRVTTGIYVAGHSRKKVNSRARAIYLANKENKNAQG